MIITSALPGGHGVMGLEGRRIKTKNILLKAVGQTRKAQKVRKCALSSKVTLDDLNMSFFKFRILSLLPLNRWSSPQTLTKILQGCLSYTRL